MECHSNWNVTKLLISFKFEYHSNWKIEKVVIPKTSNSASIGRNLILFVLELYTWQTSQYKKKQFSCMPIDWD